MAGFSFSVTIKREDEEMVREAAKQVNIRYNFNQEHNPNVPSEQIIRMVAFEFSLDALRQKNRNDTRPYTEKIKELTETLESYFKGE